MNTSPGTATARGSPVPAWPRAEPPAGTRGSPRWRGEPSVFSRALHAGFPGCESSGTGSYLVPVFLSFRIIQQLVNGIIAPTTIPNLGLGPW